MVETRGLRNRVGGDGELPFNGYQILVLQGEILEMNGGNDSCVTV